MCLNASEQRSKLPNKDKESQLKKEVNDYKKRIENFKGDSILLSAKLEELKDSLMFMDRQIAKSDSVTKVLEVEYRKLEKEIKELEEDIIPKLNKDLEEKKKLVSEDSISYGANREIEIAAKEREFVKLKQDVSEYIKRPLNLVSVDTLVLYKNKLVKDNSLSLLLDEYIQEKQEYDTFCSGIDDNKHYRNAIRAFCDIINIVDRNKRKVNVAEVKELYKKYIEPIQYIKKRYNEYTKLLIDNPKDLKIKKIEDEIFSIGVKLDRTRK